MFVQVDLCSTPPVVSLEEPTDTRQFHLAIVGSSGASSGAISVASSDLGLVYGALVDAAAGRLEGDDAWISVDAVRRMASGRVGPEWDGDFASMLDYAATKGWLDEAGHAIKAHVEWAA
jgi:hypothetical protein